ncbi:MAG: hypothetical protein WCK31_05240 [bacterium]
MEERSIVQSNRDSRIQTEGQSSKTEIAQYRTSGKDSLKGRVRYLLLGPWKKNDQLEIIQIVRGNQNLAQQIEIVETAIKFIAEQVSKNYVSTPNATLAIDFLINVQSNVENKDPRGVKDSLLEKLIKLPKGQEYIYNIVRTLTARGKEKAVLITTMFDIVRKSPEVISASLFSLISKEIRKSDIASFDDENLEAEVSIEDEEESSSKDARDISLDLSELVDKIDDSDSIQPIVKEFSEILKNEARPQLIKIRKFLSSISETVYSSDILTGIQEVVVAEILKVKPTYRVVRKVMHQQVRNNRTEIVPADLYANPTMAIKAYEASMTASQKSNLTEIINNAVNAFMYEHELDSWGKNRALVETIVKDGFKQSFEVAAYNGDGSFSPNISKEHRLISKMVKDGINLRAKKIVSLKSRIKMLSTVVIESVNFYDLGLEAINGEFGRNRVTTDSTLNTLINDLHNSKLIENHKLNQLEERLNYLEKRTLEAGIALALSQQTLPESLLREKLVNPKHAAQIIRGFCLSYIGFNMYKSNILNPLGLTIDLIEQVARDFDPKNAINTEVGSFNFAQVIYDYL